MTNLPSSPTYVQLLTDVKEKIRQAQIKAVVAVNQEMLSLYWEIGKAILARQDAEGWGSKVADQLSSDLKREFPGMKVFQKETCCICGNLQRRILILKLCKSRLHKLVGITTLPCFKNAVTKKSVFGMPFKPLKMDGQEI